MKSNLFFFAFLVFNLVLLGTQNVYAYLDPGTGSYLMQVIIGVILGGGVALKLGWKRIMDRFKNKKIS